ncbi:RNA polymerase subunit sigma-24 [Myxococcus xanthus]|uniref:RNA polymerase subunit sigma-24 n=1 Tax=Myxococcus xanthus TaxID=34 RepID=A0AAE6KQE6_MYXXA|nr:RNA polymerase sigma factor [Myxococcus xanthus]QDE66126.1 RNA polymerase subunit sigma-24 [Myxococcus xanthus]QDE73399.1 RNA polymerase subunit sigma-24 [Myxococcus xanthus]
MMDTTSILERAHREDYGRIVATLIRVLDGDFGAAEEVVQDAFAAALKQWPREGVPREPAGWLMRVARNKAVDRMRRSARLEARVGELEAVAPSVDAAEWQTLPDDSLRLLFTCCHPALSPEAQVALALRCLCGLTTEQIARAFLVSPATLAQRLVRAQRKIRTARIPYVIPEPEALAERTEGVLHTLYLVFSEGYAATDGPALLRVDLCEEALRLARLARSLLPEDAEVASLRALMLLHHSRRRARVAADGGLVLLDRQDRSLWDGAQRDEGLAELESALGMGARGAYTVQAAIAALHAQAPRAEDTDWAQIAALYARLVVLTPGPVVALNHAAAVAMARGPEHGLSLVDDLEASGRLADYHLLPAARADLLRRLGRKDEAVSAYRRALAMVRTAPERRFLEARLRELLAE